MNTQRDTVPTPQSASLRGLGVTLQNLAAGMTAMVAALRTFTASVDAISTESVRRVVNAQIESASNAKTASSAEA